MSPSAAAAADLTSGLSSFSAFSASFSALALFGIRPKTRIAVARSLVLSPVQAVSRICHASSLGVWGTLGVAVSCGPAPLTCGFVVGCCPGSLGGVSAPGFVACGCAGAFVCGGDPAVVDWCCPNSKQDAINTKAEILGKATVRMNAPSTRRKRHASACGQELFLESVWPGLVLPEGRLPATLRVAVSLAAVVHSRGSPGSAI